MDKDTFFCKNTTLNVAGKLVILDEPKVMGILNITQDSFFAGSRVNTQRELLQKADKMLEEGAFFLDIGAVSTRPGAEAIEAALEQDRIRFAVSAIKKTFPEVLISIDTYRASVAKVGIDCGASLINDISGGTLDLEMHALVATQRIPYILMHMRGTPKNMLTLAKYSDITVETIAYFSEKIFTLRNLGIRDIIIDPGFGFAKHAKHNFTLLKELKALEMFNLPILAGLSRKAMIYKTLNDSAENALAGTIALNMLALQNGANILRVHDVKEAVSTIKLFKAVNR